MSVNDFFTKLVTIQQHQHSQRAQLPELTPLSVWTPWVHLLKHTK